MSKRFRNALKATVDPDDQVDYQYGMARTIKKDEVYFEFSPFGLCDNWIKLKYDDVETHQSLFPMKCNKDGIFYQYYKIKFK